MIKMRQLFTMLAASGLALCAGAEEPAVTNAPPVIIPRPQSMIMGVGRCGNNGAVRVERVTTIPPEGYELSIRQDGIVIRCSDDAGAFYARRSLMHIDGTGGYPCLEIKDAPAFRWRGVHLDCARAFFDKNVVKGILMQMSWYKFNVLHWHLTDDEFWTLPVPGYPKLLTDAARYKGEGGYPAVKHAVQHYTEAEIKEIIAYAASLHITVVPEIEFPGHFGAVARAYPELACRKPDGSLGGGFHPNKIWGVACPGNPKTIRFIERALDYVCDVFPSKVIHIGGDECLANLWKSCPACQELMKREGMKGVEELQPWVTRYFTAYLEKKGRRVMGWNEMLAGDAVPKSAIGQFWHHYGIPDGAEGVKRGHEMVMSPTSHCYFDYGQGLGEADPFVYIGGHLPLSKVYTFDPLAGVPAEMSGKVLGGECCNWTSHTWNKYDLEWKLWPRGMAVAEALWTAPKKRDYDAFAKRAAEHRRRLVKSHINAAPIK